MVNGLPDSVRMRLIGDSASHNAAAAVLHTPISSVARSPKCAPNRSLRTEPSSVAPSPINSSVPFTQPSNRSGVTVWRRLTWVIS